MGRREQSKDSRFSVRHAKRQRFFLRSGQSLRATPGILLWNSFAEKKQQAVEQSSKQGPPPNLDNPFATRNSPLWAPLSSQVTSLSCTALHTAATCSPIQGTLERKAP